MQSAHNQPAPAELTFSVYQDAARATAVFPSVKLLMRPPVFDAALLRTYWQDVDHNDPEDVQAFAEAYVPTMLDILDTARDGAWLYPLLGLLGETGELAEKFKKLVRDHDGALTPEYRTTVLAEAGDTYWYGAAIADSLQATMSEVAAGNLAKLASRQARGQLKGSGDDR